MHCSVCVCAMHVLQSGTSHNLGDNFARAFNTQFVDEQQQMRCACVCVWGGGGGEAY